MALGGQGPAAAATTAAVASHAACSDAATAPAAAPADAWLAEACCVRMDGEGNVVSHLPALLAAAVNRLIAAAAAADATLLTEGHTPRLQPTRLHGCRPPGISVDAYAERLLRYCKCSPVAFVAAFAYMLRLQCGGARVRVDSLTAHRLMAVGAVVATKFFDDKYYSNEHYSQVAGVSLAEFNAMEIDFLFRIDFRARVAVPELAAALHEMEALASGHAVHAAAHAQAQGPAQPLLSGDKGAGQSAAEGEDSCSDATTVAALCPSPARAACVDHGVASAAPPLPWAGDDAAQHMAAQPCSKRRCSLEAQQPLPGGAEDLHRLAEPICQA